MLQIDRVQLLSGHLAGDGMVLFFEDALSWRHFLSRLTYRTFDSIQRYMSADNRFEENHPDLLDGE